MNVGATVDTSKEHNPQGELYMPSHKYVAEWFRGCWHLSSLSTATKEEAIAGVRRFVEGGESAKLSGYVYHRESGKVVFSTDDERE